MASRSRYDSSDICPSRSSVLFSRSAKALYRATASRRRRSPEGFALRFYDPVPRHPDPFDLRLHHVPVLHVLGRHTPEADAFGSAGGDDVPRLECHSFRQVFDADINRKDHVRGRRILPYFAVQAKRDPLLMWIAEFVCGDDDGAHWTEAVEALALEPLEVAFLQVACGDIIEDRVAENAVERGGSRHV